MALKRTWGVPASPIGSASPVWYVACVWRKGAEMRRSRTVLVVESDARYGRARAVLLRREGDHVQLVRTSSQALLAARRRKYDLAIVDLFVSGGGAELARSLSRYVPRLLLALGARMTRDEILEAAL